MHELLEDQMVKKMRDQDKSNKKLQIASGNNSDSGDSGEIRKKSSKILSFFQRSTSWKNATTGCDKLKSITTTILG